MYDIIMNIGIINMFKNYEKNTSYVNVFEKQSEVHLSSVRYENFTWKNYVCI